MQENAYLIEDNEKKKLSKLLVAGLNIYFKQLSNCKTITKVSDKDNEIKYSFFENQNQALLTCNLKNSELLILCSEDKKSIEVDFKVPKDSIDQINYFKDPKTTIF